jgi:hypothetical protein
MTWRVESRNAVLLGTATAILALQLLACSSSGPDNARSTSSNRAKRSAIPADTVDNEAGKATVGREAERRDGTAQSDTRSQQNVTAAPSNPAYTERSERVMGYRLQLHSTTDHSEARRAMSTMRKRLDSLGMEEGRMDLVFDAPYYKLRYGDYIMKADADRERGVFHELGIPAAFVVRDHIVRIIRERLK